MNFTPTHYRNMCGSSLHGYVTASYYELRQMFGDPLPGGSSDNKVSTEWRFVGDDGSVISLYDYKATVLYSKSYPTVEAFRRAAQYQWHVGALRLEQAQRFIYWLKTKLGMLVRSPQDTDSPIYAMETAPFYKGDYER